MEKRPDAVTMAQWSYYLAYASSGILLLAFIFSLLRVPFSSIVWLALITSAIGTFMAFTARRELKANPGPPESMKMLRTAWRVNLGALIVMLIALVLYIIVFIVFRFGPGINADDTALLAGLRLI